MVRILLIASLAALSLSVLAACGGDDEPSGDPTVNGTSSGPPIGLTPTKTAPDLRPTPPPVAADADAIAVVAPGKDDYTPTVTEIKALPTKTIANESGVTLAALAEKAGAATPMFVAIEGTTKNNRFTGVARYTYAEVADSTILVLDAEGHLHMASTSIGADELLIYVTSVAFN